jgi:hypothetical protein
MSVSRSRNHKARAGSTRAGKTPVAGNLAYLDPEFADASKRIANAMTLHALAGSAGRFAAFKIADGSSPDHNTVYDTRIEAVAHQKWDLDTVMYLEITPDGMQPREAGALLQWWRFLYSRGWRYPYPEFDFDGGMPDLKSDRLAMANHLISGGKSLWPPVQQPRQRRAPTSARRPSRPSASPVPITRPCR